MTQPSSSQCGSPRIDPVYPVDSTARSRTMTAPTCFRGQVDRVAACCAMPMKYSFHPARMARDCKSEVRGQKAEVVSVRRTLQVARLESQKSEKPGTQPF